MFVFDLRAMKDRKKRVFCIPWKAFFYLIILLLFCSANLLFFRECWQPKLVASLRRIEAIEALSGESPALPPIKIQEAVILPDQALIFLKYPSSSTPLFTKNDISCIYMLSNSTGGSQMELSPESTDDDYLGSQIVRCPLPPRGFIITVAIRSKSKGNHLLLLSSAPPTYQWNSLAYEAVIDRDNTTIVFVKGLNLRGGKTTDPSRFKCIYGWDFRKSQFTLQSDVVSIAQEIVRCRTPLSLLNNPHYSSIKVSVRVVGRRAVLNSIARLQFRLESTPPAAKKHHQMCVCTMLRNQDKFLREWVIYHGKIGVERWFIYDNNSDDDISQVIESLVNNHNYNITRHVWPWIKSQEAGFSHCALRARDSCEWVGFIDVDEFLHFPSDTVSLHDILSNKSMSKEIGELQASCHSFGPSGLKKIPSEGVMVGYTCRMIFPERHKSIVRPEALSNTLINVVHHFELKQGFKHGRIERQNMVINHYKYQVWEVFKEKFYRRVATYVSDWQQEQNVGSKDRTPGLGTRALEPPDWSSRFCEVKDTGLKDRVLKSFMDSKTGLLPWQWQKRRDSTPNSIQPLKKI